MTNREPVFRIKYEDVKTQKVQTWTKQAYNYRGV
jgi:hypothetical protein